MCIENNKCLNVFSIRTAVFLIAIASLAEGLTYYLIIQNAMITFAAADLLLFVTHKALQRSHPEFRKVTVWAYLAVNGV